MPDYEKPGETELRSSGISTFENRPLESKAELSILRKGESEDVGFWAFLQEMPENQVIALVLKVGKKGKVLRSDMEEVVVEKLGWETYLSLLKK